MELGKKLSWPNPVASLLSICISMTKQELISKLRNEEETLLVDLLNLTSDEIVDAFLDRIDDRYEYLYGQYTEEEE